MTETLTTREQVDQLEQEYWDLQDSIQANRIARAALLRKLQEEREDERH